MRRAWIAIAIAITNAIIIVVVERVVFLFGFPIGPWRFELILVFCMYIIGVAIGTCIPFVLKQKVQGEYSPGFLCLCTTRSDKQYNQCRKN